MRLRRHVVATGRGLGAVRAAERASAAGRRLKAIEARLADDDSPVIVGPWHSEVGFETLYWIPFVHRLLEKHRVDPERVTVLSRGGTSAWYGTAAAHYVDLFRVLPVERFVALKERSWQREGDQKQDEVSRWDRELVRRAVGRRTAQRAAIVHPSLMYGLLGRFWKGGMPLREVLAYLRHGRWNIPADPELEARLPDDFVAARVYFSDPFPDTVQNRALVRDGLARLARKTHVVLLNTQLAVDDHPEYDPDLTARVVRPLQGAPATDNLRLQSVVLARAQAFVGTYGGFSYLAAALGTVSISLASNPERFFPSHLDVARRAAFAAGAPFTLLDVDGVQTAALLGLAAHADERTVAR